MRTASVIIRTKDEARHLGRTLEAIINQTVRPHQIIVIDSGSTDGTLSIAARYPVEIMHIHPREWGYGRALNVAAARATGEILVCLSAHCVPISDSWLASLLRHFDDSAVAGVWGPGYRPGREVPAPGQPQRQTPGSYTVETRAWGFTNANSALRRDLWRVLPFDEFLPAAEDKAWGKAMLERNMTIVYEPAAAVWHAPHGTMAAFRRNHAVQLGYHKIFPELGSTVGIQTWGVLRRAWQLTWSRLAAWDFAGLGRDIRRLPAVSSSVVGGVLANLRERWSVFRNPRRDE